MKQILGTSRVLAVLGDPVSHSLSPVLQNAAITALGQDGVYVPFRVPPESLRTALATLSALGVAGNITIPHKIDAMQGMADVTPIAAAVGAVNTFWPEGGVLHGDNTDVAGVLEALDAVDASGPWLVAGTGGAARAVAVAAAPRDVEILVRSRDGARAAAFVTWAQRAGAEARVDDGSPARTAINATPVGLHANDPPPFPPDRMSGVDAAVDLVYARGETAWVRACRANGLRAVDGRAMLVGQGAAAFERFFPDARAPRDVMRAAVGHHLRP